MAGWQVTTVGAQPLLFSLEPTWNLACLETRESLGTQNHQFGSMSSEEFWNNPDHPILSSPSLLEPRRQFPQANKRDRRGPLTQGHAETSHRLTLLEPVKAVPFAAFFILSHHHHDTVKYPSMAV